MDIKLTGHGAGKVSFPDCEITHFHFNNNSIKFTSDGIFIESMGFFDEYVDVIIISNKVNYYSFIDNLWVDDNQSQVDGFRYIGEWASDSNDLIISGFKSTSGVWGKLVASGFSVQISSTTEHILM